MVFLLHGSPPHFVQVSAQTLPLRNLSPDYSIKNNPPSSPSSLLMCFIFSLNIYHFLTLMYIHTVSPLQNKGSLKGGHFSVLFTAVFSVFRTDPSA